jgi:hypothetical protein
MNQEKKEEEQHQINKSQNEMQFIKTKGDDMHECNMMVRQQCKKR